MIRQFQANDKTDLMHAYQHQGMLHLDAYRRAGAIHAHCAGPFSDGHVRASLGEAMALVALREDAAARQVLDRLAEGLRQGGPACRRLLGEVVSELGEFYSVRAQYAQAREALDCARAALEAELGPDHHRTCEAVVRLASVLERTGDRAGAESSYRSVLGAVESWQRFTEAWIATYGDCVARFCQQRNAHAEAEVRQRRAIREAEIAWGTKANVLAVMHYRLGAILQEQDARGATWTTLLQALGAFQRNGALIGGWTLSVGRAGAQVQIAAGDAAARVARLAPGDGSAFAQPIRRRARGRRFVRRRLHRHDERHLCHVKAARGER